MNLEPEETYRLYLAIKAHFKSDYDYFKYHGKVKTGDFRKRKDRFAFHRLAKKYDNEDIIDFLVSNCVYLPEKDFWISNLLSVDSDIIFQRFREYKQNFPKHFIEEIKQLRKEFPRFLAVENGQLPYIIKGLIGGHVSYQTVVATNQVCPFYDDIEDDLIWPDVRTKLVNFKPFVWFDHAETAAVLRQEVT